MIKLDLHTHSILSHDGGIDERGYKQILEQKILSQVAITDHDTIEYAQFCHQKFGDQIIVGEEMYAKEGHVIGLFLKQRIASHQSIQDTILAIKEQGGLVYIPHPFDSMRKGIGEKVLRDIVDSIDIIEIFNGRIRDTKQNREANVFAEKYKLISGAGSDAHCEKGVGNAYVELSSAPRQDNLLKILKQGYVHGKRMSLIHFLCPKINRLKKLLSFSKV